MRTAGYNDDSGTFIYFYIYGNNFSGMKLFRKLVFRFKKLCLGDNVTLVTSCEGSAQIHGAS